MISVARRNQELHVELQHRCPGTMRDRGHRILERLFHDHISGCSFHTLGKFRSSSQVPALVVATKP